MAMFNGKNLKILAISTLSLALVNCQGANGRRIFGGQMTALPNQTRSNNTAIPQVPQQILSAMFPGENQKGLPEMESPKNFEYSVPNWSELCKDFTGSDTDRDGISDACETELLQKGALQYAALDPSVYNGLLIGGRYFNPNDLRIELTQKERQNWNAEKYLSNLKGFGSISQSGRKIVQKLTALKDTSEQDLGALKDLYKNYSSDVVRVDDRFASYNRSPELFKNIGEDKNIALAHGDNSETFPYSAENTNASAYYLTGLGKDSDSKNARSNFMEVMEFHTVFPKAEKDNLPQMDITVGYLSDSEKNVILGSTAGVFYVLNDGESVLVSGSQKGTKYATISPSPGCQTAHIVIVYLAEANKAFSRTPSFRENVFFRTNSNDTWKNFSQGMLSTQPMGGTSCNEKFNLHDPKHENMFFDVSNAITSRVPGIVDFNTSLGSIETPDGRLTVSNDPNDSGKYGYIFTTALANDAQKIKEMDTGRINEIEKSLSLVNVEKLQPEEKIQYDAILAAIAARKAELAAPAVKVQTNPKIIQLSENGTITLDYDTMNCLAKLGFAFADEQGNVYVPKEGETKKITQAVLDQILEQIGKMLDEDKITPEQVDCLLTWLTSDAMKNNPSVIKFMADYGDKLNGLKPGEEMIRYLRKLNKEQNLGVEKAIDEFAKNDPATKSAAFKTIYDAIEKKLLDPSPASLTALPFKDRFDIAKNLLSTKFLNDEQYAALIMKLAALKYARDFEVRKDGNLQLRRSTITFNPGTNKIKGEEAESTLAYMADAIQRLKTDAQMKDIRIKIVAHTDNTPTKESSKKRIPKNEALSKGRAQAVADFLSGKSGTQPVSYSKGIISSANPYEFDKSLEQELVIQPDHIEIVGMGEKEPIASNKTEAGRNKNRRVEVIILKSSK